MRRLLGPDARVACFVIGRGVLIKEPLRRCPVIISGGAVGVALRFGRARIVAVRAWQDLRHRLAGECACSDPARDISRTGASGLIIWGQTLAGHAI